MATNTSPPDPSVPDLLAEIDERVAAGGYLVTAVAEALSTPGSLDRLALLQGVAERHRISRVAARFIAEASTAPWEQS
jgi:hypothetical protein